MKKQKFQNVLIGLVHQDEGHHPLGLCLVGLFTKGGLIPCEPLVKIYQDLKGERPAKCDLGSVGLFNTSEEIQGYCLLLAEHLRCTQVNILRSEEYNHLLASIGHIEDLKEAILQSGEIIHLENSLKRGILKGIGLLHS